MSQSGCQGYGHRILGDIFGIWGNVVQILLLASASGVSNDIGEVGRQHPDLLTGCGGGLLANFCSGSGGMSCRMVPLALCLWCQQ
jgi:hypothetical protein